MNLPSGEAIIIISQPGTITISSLLVLALAIFLRVSFMDSMESISEGSSSILPVTSVPAAPHDGSPAEWTEIPLSGPLEASGSGPVCELGPPGLQIEAAVIEKNEITVRGRVGPEDMDLDESRAVLDGLLVELQVFDPRSPTAPLALRAERILDPAATPDPQNALTGGFEQSGRWTLAGFIPSQLRSSETFRAEVRLLRDNEVCGSYQMTIQR